nr:LacI family DNA-binding transcriptional regulator [Maliibacterium massiliense]
MAVTLKDIASRVGVSVSTVSRILSGDPNRPASEATCRKVWAVATDMGYEPNPHARQLVRARATPARAATRTIGCISFPYDSESHPFLSGIMRAVRDEVESRGYLLGYLYTGGEGSQASLADRLLATPVDGAVLMGSISQEVLTIIQARVPNLIYAGFNSMSASFDGISCNSYDAAVSIIEHFITLDYRNIGYIGPIPAEERDVNKRWMNEHRFTAYCDVLSRHGFPFQREIVRNSPFVVQDAYNAMLDILSKGGKPDAIFCANDTVAIGVMRAAESAGLRVGVDIGIAGIDDIELSAFLRPALTTIRVPKEDMGRIAVKILLDRIAQGHAVPMRIELPYELIVRESCGAAYRAGTYQPR